MTIWFQVVPGPAWLFVVVEAESFHEAFNRIWEAWQIPEYRLAVVSADEAFGKGEKS